MDLWKIARSWINDSPMFTKEQLYESAISWSLLVIDVIEWRYNLPLSMYLNESSKKKV
jgi:hypothetical protein